MSREFLRESWGRKAEEETGESKESRSIELFYRFKKRAEEHPDLQSLVDSLEKDVGLYADSIIRFKLAKRGEDYDKGLIEASDQSRKLMHESLIGSVNAISRWYHRNEIDNKWRRDIIGMSREALGEWALTVARHVLGKRLEE